MRTEPLLSICIPTYNRSHYLGTCLAHILSQCSGKVLRSKIEVLISDNASTDDTRSIVHSFQKKAPFVHYYRNRRNLGFDRNVDNALTKARGRFCWTLSDDEYLVSGAIRTVLAAIEQHSEAAVLLVDNHTHLKGNKPRRFESGAAFIRTYGLEGGQISQCIFNRSFLPKDRRTYYDNLWFHYSLVLEMTARRPLVFIRNLFLPEAPGEHPCTWANGGTVFFTFTSLKNILEQLPRYGYERSFVNAQVRRLVREFPAHLLSAKVWGLPVTWKNLSLLIREYKGFPWTFLCSLSIFFLPGPLMRTLKRFKKPV